MTNTHFVQDVVTSIDFVSAHWRLIGTLAVIRRGLSGLVEQGGLSTSVLPVPSQALSPAG